MTRTRQSAVHGRRGGSRRDAVSPLQKKTQKPKENPATTPVKGRYTCGQCKKFEGPRRPVEDHCREKHRLSGGRLQKAVQLRAELKEEEAGSTREQQSPQKTTKRQRNIPVNQHAADDGGDATGAKKSREKSPVKRAGGDRVISDNSVVVVKTGVVTKHLGKDGENVEEAAKPGIKTDRVNVGLGSVTNSQDTMMLPPPVEETGSIGHMVGKLPPVSACLESQGTPEATCKKCKKTFTRSRQLIKHKCFASMDEQPKQTTKTPSSGIKKERPPGKQRDADEVLDGQNVQVTETNAGTDRPGTDDEIQESEGKSKFSERENVPDQLDSSDKSHCELQNNLTIEEVILHGMQSMTSSSKDVTSQPEAITVEAREKLHIVDKNIDSPSQGSQPGITKRAPVKLETVDISQGTLMSTSSEQSTGVSSATLEAITREAQHFGGKLPPVSTLLKPHGTPEGMCVKCKRTFSRARQLIKHKCFAVMDEDKPTQCAKPSSHTKSPKRLGTQSAKPSKKSGTSSGPKHVMDESQRTEDQPGEPKATKQSRSSESKEERENKTAVEDDNFTITVCITEPETLRDEKGYVQETLPSSVTRDAFSDGDKEQSNETTGAASITGKLPSGGLTKLPAVITTPLRPSTNTRTTSHVTVWQTFPVTAVSTSVVVSPPVSHPPSIVASSPISQPPPVVASTTITDSTGRDSSSSGIKSVAVKADVGDLPLEDILQGFEESYVGGTDTDDSVAFRANTNTTDGQKTFDDLKDLAGPSSNILTEATNVGSPNKAVDGAANNIAAAAHLTNIGGNSSKLLASMDKMSSDVKGEVSALRTPKVPKLGKYAKLAIKQEELDANDKEKIAESICLRTAQVAFSTDTPERVQIAIQNGKNFCLCSFCGTMRLEPDQMKEHLTQHIKDYLPFQCKDCDFLSRKRGRITAHMKKAHQGFLQCEFCDYNTYDKDKLDRHYKFWNRDFSNSCKFCHKKVPVGSKEEHLRIVHGKSAEEIANINLTADAFTCRHCGERLKSRHARRDHEKRHEPHFICPLCPYSTNSESVYINHGRKHRVILVCCKCLAKFHSSHSLKNHLLEHAGEDLEQLYERSISQSIFVASVLDEASIPECDIIGLDMGMRVKEEERRVTQQNGGDGLGRRPIALPVTVEEMKSMNFGVEYDCYIKNIAYRHLSMSTLSFMFARYGKRECTHCGFLLHSLGSWKIHVGSHEGKKDFHCSECEYKCRHKFLLERHVLIAHKKQDFACDLCDQRFPYREYVYLHKRKDHDGGRMKCSFCVEVPFETEVEKEMKKHIIEEHPEMTSKQIAQIIGRKVHFTGKDGILFVKCKYCQKGFNRAAFLRQHVQLVHMQKKTFLCDQCGYKSNTKARLRTHMAVHTEVRDITCNQCGAGFKNKVYLYKHIRRSHKRYATERGAAYCKRTRLKNVITLLQKERQEGSSYERQEIIQKEKAKLFGHDNKGQPSVEGVGVSQPTQINVFQCGDCGRYFENIFTLKNHFMSVHGESPNIPLDFEAAMAGGGSAIAPNEQVNIALDALNKSGNTSSVEQLFQCAKCNRMFPDMKSVEHHVKDIHATDTFLISDEGDIPSQELDLAAEVINHLTRETGQSGAINMMQSIVSQSTLDALSIEAQNAATALTTLPDAVLEMSNQSELVSLEVKSEDIQSTSQEGQNNQQKITGVDQISSSEPKKAKVEVVPERRDEMEAAHLLQQMGIFQQFTTTTASNETVVVGAPSSDSPLGVEPRGRNEEAVQPGEGEDSVTIMLIEDSENKQ